GRPRRRGSSPRRQFVRHDPSRTTARAGTPSQSRHTPFRASFRMITNAEVCAGWRPSSMTFLVAVTAMHQRVLAEHVLDRAPQRLGAVDHEQDRLLWVEAAV